MQTLSALRAAAKAAFNLECMSADQLGRIMNVKMIRGSRDLAGREVKLGELEALVRVCVDDETPTGARDAVVLGLLYICGLRRMEVASLDVQQYNAADGDYSRHRQRQQRSAWCIRIPARRLH